MPGHRPTCREFMLWLCISALLAAGVFLGMRWLAGRRRPTVPTGNGLRHYAMKSMFDWDVWIALYKREYSGLPLASRTEKQDLEAVRMSVGRPQHLDLEDPWGNPFNLYLDADGDGFIAIGDRLYETDIYMYSSGRNEVDELGQGDDIVLPFRFYNKTHWADRATSQKERQR